MNRLWLVELLLTLCGPTGRVVLVITAPLIVPDPLPPARCVSPILPLPNVIVPAVKRDDIVKRVSVNFFPQIFEFPPASG